MAGKLVFYQGGANFLNMIKENAPQIYNQTDVCEQIKGPVGQNDFSVMNFVIPLKAKNKKEALDFCLFLTNAENQLERLIWFLENNGFKYESENAKQLRGIKNIKIYIDRRF
jgi:ABC-type glycerol-3-phosphate transport system substrate-binding protein